MTLFYPCKKVRVSHIQFFIKFKCRQNPYSFSPHQEILERENWRLMFINFFHSGLPFKLFTTLPVFSESPGNKGIQLKLQMKPVEKKNQFY